MQPTRDFASTSITAALFQWDQGGSATQIGYWDGASELSKLKLVHINRDGRYLEFLDGSQSRFFDTSTLRYAEPSAYSGLDVSPFAKPSDVQGKILTQRLKYIVYRKAFPVRAGSALAQSAAGRDNSWAYADRSNGQHGTIPETYTAELGDTPSVFVDAGESERGALQLLYVKDDPGRGRRFSVLNDSLTLRATITVRTPATVARESAITRTNWDSLRHRMLVYQTAHLTDFPRPVAFSVLDYETGSSESTIVDVASAFKKLGDAFILREEDANGTKKAQAGLKQEREQERGS